jgi:NTE family protein
MDFSPTYIWLDLMSRIFSPYEINPLGLNPMRPILENMLDIQKMQACSAIKLFITATHVASGQARVFKCHEITTDVLLASACIPFLFQAVEIDGEQYWDGGYMGNPAIWPLIYNCQSRDVVLVQINPLQHDEVPRSAGEIINRLNEITFNSSLIAEMRAIDFVSKLIQKGALDKTRYKDMNMHLIYGHEAMGHLNASSKVNADWDFFMFLKTIGRETAEKWLKANWAALGVRSSVNIRETFLSGAGAHPKGDLHELPPELKQKPKKNQKKQARKPK